MSRRTAVVALAATLVALAPISTSPAGAASASLTVASGVAAPRADVDPFGSLTNGQKVWVSGDHFVPGDQVVVAQCNKLFTGLAAACDLLAITNATKYGRLPARSYPVVTGLVGVSRYLYPCDHTHLCTMVVADLQKQVGVAVPIYFAP